MSGFKLIYNLSNSERRKKSSSSLNCLPQGMLPPSHSATNRKYKHVFLYQRQYNYHWISKQNDHNQFLNPCVPVLFLRRIPPYSIAMRAIKRNLLFLILKLSINWESILKLMSFITIIRKHKFFQTTCFPSRKHLNQFKNHIFTFYIFE